MVFADERIDEKIVKKRYRKGFLHGFLQGSIPLTLILIIYWTTPQLHSKPSVYFPWLTVVSWIINHKIETSIALTLIGLLASSVVAHATGKNKVEEYINSFPARKHFTAASVRKLREYAARREHRNEQLTTATYHIITILTIITGVLLALLILRDSPYTRDSHSRDSRVYHTPVHTQPSKQNI